jgi:hypothetical protein
MKKFCVLIPKLNQPLSKSLSPVSIFHGNKIMNLSFATQKTTNCSLTEELL